MTDSCGFFKLKSCLLLACLTLMAGCGGSTSTPDSLQDPADQNPEPAMPPEANPGDTPPVVTPTLAPVSNLRGVVYTNSEIELFWDRATDGSGVTGYNIARDGEFLERRDGISFYDSALQPGITYAYTITTVGDGNSVGTGVEISLLTLPDEPEITVAKSQQLLEYVLLIANDTLLDEWVTQVNPAEGGATTTGFDTGEFTLYECVTGGTTTTRPYGSAQSGGTSTDYDACRSPDTHAYVQIDGNYSTRFSLSKLVWNVGLFTGSDYDLAAINSLGREVRFTGEDGNFDGENSDTSMRKLNLSAGAFEGTTTITADLFMIAGTGETSVRAPYARVLDGTFTVQSPRSGNRLLSADFPIAPESSLDGGCYEQGQLRVQAVDGGQLLVNFDTGNAATFEMVVINGDQKTSSIKSWSEVFLSLNNEQQASGLISAVCG